jgi:hypothetical protein
MMDGQQQQGETAQHQTTAYAATVDMRQAWPQKVGQDVLQQPTIHVEQGHTLYEELVSWIDDDWQPYGAYG